jgi:hypothetical protein
MKNYIDKLIDNLPDNVKNTCSPTKLDIVLDGGVFNGSYLIGALLFLKEMENRKYIIVERISGCSIGSIAAFLYTIDSLDLFEKLYGIVFDSLKKEFNLNIIKNIKEFVKDRIPSDICSKINNKLFITFYNIKKGKKIVKCKFKTVDCIISSLIKSSFVPFLIDGNLLFERKYIDGINPFVFTPEEGKKILYLDLFGYDKITNLLNVKNEKTNFHRILSGLLDIHNFYIKQSNTPMCSYVNDWTLLNRLHAFIKYIVERSFIISIQLFLKFKKYIPEDIENSILFQIFKNITYDIYVVLLKNYCL